MAVIVRHPDVEDYITEMSLAEIIDRGGVADRFEQGRLIIIKDYRLDFDFDALSGLCKSIDSVEDPELRRRLKKLLATTFFEGRAARKRWGKPAFDDPLRQEVYDTICNGDHGRFNRASRALKAAHDQALRIFETCFPGYEPFRFIPSLRLTRTLFENLHWDNHLIEADFHQARLFANLDRRPRIWNVGRRLPEWMRTYYSEHDLGRFAGKDPNLLIDYVTSEVLGGTRNTWMDSEPRHRIAFEPGEVWLGESRLISHQIVYGESALVYMWFVEAASMAEPGNRFNAQMEAVHRQMRDQAAAA